MNPTDILLSIAIVGIYTLIYVYLKSKYDDNKIIIKLFVVGFVYATIIKVSDQLWVWYHFRRVHYTYYPYVLYTAQPV